MTELTRIPPSGENEIRRGRAEAIRAFLQQFGGTANDDLFYQMLVTICRLAQDDPDRGDLKLLNTALKELRYSFKIFRAYADIPKVSIFGSARTPEGHPQYEEARKFAELIEKAGWMVITGAGDGIMRAGHHGAKRESSFGVAISLPFEQRTNTIIEGDAKLINFKYFFTRKLMFVKEAKAIVLFPGGFGTQDEGFEALTLVQTGKSAPLPVVLCDEPGGTYWQHWRTYVKAELLGNHMIDREDLNLFTLTDRAEDAVEVVKRYYHRYHSARYVGDLMVMRLSSPLPPGRLDEINREYADILTSGVYEVHDAALPEEDGEYANLPRLVFAFNRRSAGKLRRMIDLINTD